MEIKIRTEAKIGFIVLSTIILVIWGINFLKGKNVLKRTDVFYAVFDNVQGLEYAAPVFISGYKVGLINNIGFDKTRLDRIIVAFVVEKQYSLPKGSVVKIASPDLISGKALMIELASSSQYHTIGDTLLSGIDESLMDKLQSGIDPIIENASTTVLRIDSLITSIHGLFNEEYVRKLQSTIHSSDQLAGRLNQQFAPDGNLTMTIENLEKLTASLSEGREDISKTISNLSDISDTLVNSGMGEMMENLTSVTAEIHVLLNSINSGNGTLGMLASDDSLYVKLVDVSSSLDLLLTDMKERPKRYVHFSLFGKKDKN